MEAGRVGSNMTLIFVSIYPFNDDYAVKYGFDILKKRGFNITILHVLNILYSKNIAKELSHYNKLVPIAGIEQVCVKTWKDLKKYLDLIKGWRMVFLVVSPDLRLLKIFKRLSISYVMMFLNVQPAMFVEGEKIWSRFFRVVKRLLNDPVNYFSAFMLHRLPYTLLGIDYPKYVVLGSKISNYRFPLSKKQVICAHSFDYDRYLRNKNIPKPGYIPEGDYYVHLACPPWYTHDYVVMGVVPELSKEEYARIINNFYDFVEKKTGIKVVIATHPKHTEKENVYGGRPYLHYSTEQLIKYSSGVFCHYSGAIKFAVIHRKPICFTSSRKTKTDVYFQGNIKAYSSCLKAEINYIDNNEDWQKLLDKGFFYYDKESYEVYERNYITINRSEERFLWDIVADALIEREKQECRRI